MVRKAQMVTATSWFADVSGHCILCSGFFDVTQNSVMCATSGCEAIHTDARTDRKFQKWFGSRTVLALRTIAASSERRSACMVFVVFARASYEKVSNTRAASIAAVLSSTIHGSRAAGRT
jgi:hypothetical protein